MEAVNIVTRVKYLRFGALQSPGGLLCVKLPGIKSHSSNWQVSEVSETLSGVYKFKLVPYMTYI